MKHHLSFSVFLLLLLDLRSSGQHCGPDQYPFDDVKCCLKCAPGTEMQSRCTKHTETLCRPCGKGRYNPLFTTWECKQCSICESANGLREVKKCEHASDAVCLCLPGFQPATFEPDEKRCDPCPRGHFSKGGDEACTPWTKETFSENAHKRFQSSGILISLSLLPSCTATGRNTFRVGTEKEDTVCDNAPMVPRTTEPPAKGSSRTGTVRATSVTKPTSKSTSVSSTSIALSTEGLPDGVKKSAYLSYILIAAALLLVLGGIVLLKICRRTKKYKEPGRFVEQMQKDGKNSFRIPIQEEQIDAKSSLVQN